MLPRAPRAGHAQNVCPVTTELRATRVRLNIYPDGGVARLRVWGEPRPDWTRLSAGKGHVDLVAATVGGVTIMASDQFFMEPHNMQHTVHPGYDGAGWLTRRR